MKHFNKYILLSLLSLSAIGCINEEEIAPVIEKETVKMTFTASIENNADTKTTLGESDEYGHRKLLWQPGDTIGIGYYSTFYKFTNTNEEPSEIAIFEGEGSEQEVYYAFYPYQEDLYMSWEPGFQFNLPAVQKYAENTFAPESNPMLAKASRGEELKFINLCGILVINVKGEENVKSISFSAKDENGNQAKLTGRFSVMMDFVEDPVMVAQSSNGGLVTLDCGEGVQLDPNEVTPFYLVIPPGTYSDLMVTISTTDGKVMMKKGANDLNITRAQYISAGTLDYIPEIDVDLSKQGTANCYIVKKEGVYSFDASIIGNGEFGLKQSDDYMMATSYHTTDATLAPESAELLWTDDRGSIGGVSYDKVSKRISFVATGAEGNSVIAAKDVDGNIIWSWHIWCTDEPQEHVYVNSTGTYTVLDRNIGAIRADGGSSDYENRESIGAMYQWGRKDPFYAVRPENSDWNMYYSRKGTQYTIEESIKFPTTLAGSDDWNKNGSYNLWSTTGKTIYDPCPTGYRVAVTNIFRSFTKDGNDVDRGFDINHSGSFDKGFNFYYDGVNTTWYPVTTSHWYYNWGLEYHENNSYIWSANQSALYFYYNDDYECSIRLNESHSKGHAFPVRCMADTDAESLILSMNKVTDIKATSATATGRISVYGDPGIESAGFVVGSSMSVDITTGRVFKTDNTKGNISAEITGLNPMTRYYAKVYVTTDEGTQYSEAYTFHTPNNDGVINLSANGKANCYIVTPGAGVYTFDAVKGNSSNSVGEVDSADVLWETYNTSETVTANSVIASAEWDGKQVKFTMPENSVPGNAVIAAKDADGTILWSWHIWVVDFDPVATQQKYISGAVMMDRNLGALNIADNDSRSYGMLYQWGRKDPFPSSASASAWEEYNYVRTYPDLPMETMEKGTYEQTISNPRTSFTGTDWNSDNTLWNPDKSIYDPCPAGWVVPEIEAWYNISTYGWNGWYNLAYMGTTGPTAYYPTGGYMDCWYNKNYYGEYSYCYSCTTGTSNHAQFFRIGQNDYYTNALDKDNLLSVRCQRLDVSDKEGDGDDYIVDDDYTWN